MTGLWQAMAGRPHRFLLSRWPLRCLGYLVSSVVVGVALLMALVIGVLFPPAVVFLGLPVGALERRRLRILDSAPVLSPHAVPPPGLGGWLRSRLGEGATWRELGYVLALASALLLVDLVSLGILADCVVVAAAPVFVAAGEQLQFGGLVIDGRGEAFAAAAVAVPAGLLGVYALCAVAGTQAALARWLLAPRDAELSRRVEELARSRGRLLNAFEAERRRIERDLHDGAQQHLVLLAMTLGLARLELDGDRGTEGGKRLVEDAQRQARQALAAIRELIHGIHPQVLTDLGLPAAVGELAERCQVPVVIDLPLPGRLPAAVETTAYFVVCEALTNAVRHARASRVTVSGHLDAGRLTMTVTDDGDGGADPGAGTGLRGLADRTAVMDGTFTVTSPVGGPTTLRVDLPCGLSLTPTGVRIVLADDAVLLREGLASLLERFGHTVAAAVGDAEALLAAAAEHRPDLVITDVRMPPTHTDEGLRAALTLRAGDPQPAVLVLSQYTATAYAAGLLAPAGRAGIGYLLKDRVGDIAEFAGAVARVAAGETVIDPDVVRQLLTRQRAADPLARLTPREREVLGLMAEGRSNAWIARTLLVGDAAVAKHIGNIFAKLDLPGPDDGHRRVLAVLTYLRG